MRPAKLYSASLALLVSGLVLSCAGGSVPTGAETGVGGDAPDGVRVLVDGTARDFSAATVRLCSEGLPGELSLIVTTTRPDCPEQYRQGPAGTRLSRGRLCDELSVRARGFEIGAASQARGTSQSVVAYTQYEEPVVWASTGDTGPTDAAGSVTVTDLRELAGGEYRLELSVAVEGEAEVRAEVAVTVSPSPCLSASPS